MSKKLHNPHDKFVRETFSDPERAQAFVEEFLPEKIVKELDLSRLKVSHDSYLDNEMKEYFSDLILKIPVKKQRIGILKLPFSLNTNPVRTTTCSSKLGITCSLIISKLLGKIKSLN